jgi:hypothetical protein
VRGPQGCPEPSRVRCVTSVRVGRVEVLMVRAGGEREVAGDKRTRRARSVGLTHVKLDNWRRRTSLTSWLSSASPSFSSDWAWLATLSVTERAMNGCQSSEG